MSNRVITAVYSRHLGSMARKAILAHMADRANDDGGGIWTSKGRMARDVECTKKTVISTIRGLIQDGILVEAGKRRVANGYVAEYSINLRALMALPSSDDPKDKEQFEPEFEFSMRTKREPDTTGGKGDRCKITPVLGSHLHQTGVIPTPEPSLTNRTQKESTSLSSYDTPKKATRWSEDDVPPEWKQWAATEFPDWPQKHIDSQAQRFSDYWRARPGKAGLKLDWQATWRNWTRRAYDQHCNETKRNGGGDSLASLAYRDLERSRAAGEPVRDDDAAAERFFLGSGAGA